MMKRKHIQVIIALAIFFLFANWAWAAAEHWILYASNDDGILNYDRNSIRIINKNTISVDIELMLNDYGKKSFGNILKKYDLKAPDSPEIMSRISMVHEIDCVKVKSRVVSLIFYDYKNNPVFSDSGKSEWTNITHGSTLTIIEKIVCSSCNTSKAEKTGKSLHERLRAFVNEHSKEIPEQKGSVTTLTDMALTPDNTVLAKYKIDVNGLIRKTAENVNLSDKEFRRNIIKNYGSVDKYFNIVVEEKILNYGCHEPSIRGFLDEGVIFKLVYYDNQGRVFKEILMNKNKCSKY
jgi:uncharacterized ubiquitin-like protein YukD